MDSYILEVSLPIPDIFPGNIPSDYGIYILAPRTVETFKRKLSRCEMIEYLEYTEHDNLMRIKQMLENPSCESMASIWNSYDLDQLREYIDNHYYNGDETTDRDATWDTSRGSTEITTRQTATISFSPTRESGGGGGEGEGGGGEGGSGRGTGGRGKAPQLPPVVSSVPSVILSTNELLDKPDKHDDLNEDDKPPPPPTRRKRIVILDLRTTSKAFDIIDIVIMVCFSLDLLLRLVSCPSILRFCLSVINTVDVIALVRTYI